MKNKGFTLVEILIVVVILGILAAIVIPQFSDASTQSKVSSSLSSLQSLRSQIQLYKIQHNDVAPTLAAFEAQMTTYSDVSGGTNAVKDVDNGFIFGPYVQSVPANPWNNSNGVTDGTGWTYDEDTGNIYLNVTVGTDCTQAVYDDLDEAGAILVVAP